ncbi:nucleotidyltransferase family protein [uncultured Imperialibacter sp.]|uniref:nucleotidyltransferase family protein n=1 Tax=uncultured Imperialibacter sp. TaxID=1672639 RepID=UPI0030DB87D4
MSSSMPQVPKKAKLSIVLLAAGSSSRLGQAKQLLPFKDTTLVRHRVATITRALGNEHNVFVVTGAKREEVRTELAGLSYTEVYNDQFSEGMSTSIKAGLACLPTDAEAVMFLLVDQPFVSEKHLSEMVGKWLNDKSKVLGAAYSGIIGVPAIFPRSYFEQLLLLKGDQGARKILKNLSDAEVLSYPLPEASIDLDTLEDLKAIGL